MNELPEVSAEDELWCQLHYTTLLFHAMGLHGGQVDRGGAPYAEHLVFVADHQPTYAGRVIALYHDSIEDEKTTAESLLTYGLPRSIVVRIELMSRRPGQNYEDYVIEVCKDGHTRRVKRWDVKHNLQLDRLSDISEKDIPRIRRYQWALRLIKEFDHV